MFNRTMLDTYKNLRIRFADGENGAGGEATKTESTDTKGADTTASTDSATRSQTSDATPPAWDGKIESLDPAAQKIISDLRKEAGDNRVKATAAETRTQAILKAAGLAPEEKDPAALLAAAQQNAANSARELAVFKAASTAGADPTKLLDRASFITSIKGIDPSDGPAIKAAIDAAVTADASLKAARAAGASSVDTSGGTGETGQITEAQLAQMTPEQIDKAYREGKLKHLLG